jgi:hypothetical protein
MQIFVIGMHRSGTSNLTRVLNLLGVSLGDEGKLMFSAPGQTPEMNAKGLWERLDVITANEQLLQTTDSSWFKVSSLDPDNFDTAGLKRFRESAQAIVAELDQQRPWAIKDPRLCLTFPAWKSLVTKPVCVFCLRNPIAIAASHRKRDTFGLQFGIALWEKYLRCAVRATVDVPRFAVRYEDIMDDPVNVTHALVDRLRSVGVDGMHEPDEEQLRAFVDRDLQHHRYSDEDLEEYLTRPQLDLFDDLISGKAFSSNSLRDLSKGAQETLEHGERLIEWLMNG